MTDADLVAYVHRHGAAAWPILIRVADDPNFLDQAALTIATSGNLSLAQRETFERVVAALVPFIENQ